MSDKIRSWALALKAHVKTKTKTRPSVRLDPEYHMKMAVVNMTGPEFPHTLYLTLDDLKTMTKRARKVILKKRNILIPVEKMSELIKSYPKEVGARRCQGVVGKLTPEVLLDNSRHINLNIKKGELKVKLGSTTQDMGVIQARAKVIVDHLRTEGYEVSSTCISHTQGACKKLEL